MIYIFMLMFLSCATYIPASSPDDGPRLRIHDPDLLEQIAQSQRHRQEALEEEEDTPDTLLLFVCCAAVLNQLFSDGE